MRSNWSAGGVEPRLDEVLADPIVHLVMRRDGIGPEDVRQAMRMARRPRPSATPDAGAGMLMTGND